MKLHIPHLSEKLILSKDWSFRVFLEERNQSLIDLILGKRYSVLSHWAFYSNGEKPIILVENYSRYEIFDKLVDMQLLKVTKTQALIPSFIGKGIGTASRDAYELDRPLEEIYLNYTIPKDSILSVDRIYIRKGSRSFDSVTFRWNKNRFWVKLDDANKIEFTL